MVVEDIEVTIEANIRIYITMHMDHGGERRMGQ